MKKILLLTENFPPIDGGSSRWFLELYSRLIDYEVHVITHQLKENEKEINVKPHIKLVRMNLASSEWGLKSIVGLKFYVRAVMKVSNYIKDHSIEEVHCGRVIHEGVIAWLTQKFTGISFRCFVHGEDIETANTSREQKLLVQRVCKNAKSLICNSQNSANLIRNLGFSNRHICKILNPGVDTEKFYPSSSDKLFRENMGWTNRFVLLTVGRLQRRKGQDFLIKALPELIKIREDLIYVIIGTGELITELHQSIKSLGITNSVQILSNANDEKLIKCYQNCDGFILPNRTIDNDIEGFGMVLVEAQACGKAVVAGDSGGTRETMVVGKTGFIIDCNSPESIVNQLGPLISPTINEEGKRICKLTSCQEYCREYVMQKLDWNAHVDCARLHFSE